MNRPFVLTILDGWGYARQKIGNAISNADTKNIKDIEDNFPSVLLQASGLGVGMTWGESGNSEVGHLTLGAGRPILQYITRINREIESGKFIENEAFKKAAGHVQERGSTLHLLGLLTIGSVHAYLGHLVALIKLFSFQGINLKLHLFTDGKDSGLNQAPELINKVKEYLGSEMSIATIVGRDYAMNRNGQWDLTKAAYDLWTQGKGIVGEDIYTSLENFYKEGFTDTRVPPTIFDQNSLIKDGDALLFFNFREDSMRQIIRAFVDDNFNMFERKPLTDLTIVTMTKYIDSKNLHAAYFMPTITNGLAEHLSLRGKTQLHIAETEKSAHVTYFFNCLSEGPLKGETDILLDSHDDPISNPEMQTRKITEKVIEELNRDYYDFILVNYANADVLAHSGNLEVTVMGVQTIDDCIGKLKDAVLAKNGFLLITSDHGNAEVITYKSSGDPQTKHDQSPVPLYIVAKEYERRRLEDEIGVNREEPSALLSDVAPTILDLMGVDIPSEMIGETLVRKIR